MGPMVTQRTPFQKISDKTRKSYMDGSLFLLENALNWPKEIISTALLLTKWYHYYFENGLLFTYVDT